MLNLFFSISLISLLSYVNVIWAQPAVCIYDAQLQSQQLTAHLIKYKEIDQRKEWKIIKQKLTHRIGDRHQNISSIKHNLNLLGLYHYKTSVLTDSFDLELERSVKKFQRLHYIDTTGIVAAKTINALRVPLSKRIRQIELNISRWKESNLNCNDYFVFINIASCKLVLINENKTQLEMNVVVGRKDRQSQNLISVIHQIEFNPYWIVPPGILKKDIIPKLLKNPNYLDEVHLNVYTWANEKVYGTIHPDDLINFKVQQDPEESNPMGKIKFHFKNTHFMFLHDHPNKQLFNKYPAAFSSGCIRIANATALARYLLQTDDGFTAADVNGLLNQSKNKLISLKKPINIIINYFTCWVNHNGELIFATDFYTHDR